MEYKESDVKNLIAVGYLTGVVDAFGKSINISQDDMKTRMMKSNTIRTTLVDDITNIDAVGLVKSGKSIASDVLAGRSATTSSVPPTESLFQKAEHAIEGLFYGEPKHDELTPAAEPVASVVEPVVPVVEPVTPVVEPVVPVVEPVTPVVEPVAPATPNASVVPVTPNASVVNPMNQAAPPAPYTPTPNVIGGRKKNKSKKRKTKRVKKSKGTRK